MPIPFPPVAPLSWAALFAIILGPYLGTGPGKQHEAMEQFIFQTIEHLDHYWSWHNALVWHNTGQENVNELHGFNGFGPDHYHYELHTPFPANNYKSYECNLFLDGFFSMEGDLGYINWGMIGNFTREPGNDGQNRKVTFYPRKDMAFLEQYAKPIQKPVDGQLPTPFWPEVRVDGFMPIEQNCPQGDKGPCIPGFPLNNPVPPPAERTLPTWNATVQRRDTAPPRAKAGSISSAPLRGATPRRAERPNASALRRRRRRRAGGATLAREQHSDDGVYFVHCENLQHPGETARSSGLAYYKNFQPDSGKNLGQQPDSLVWVGHGHGAAFTTSTGAAEFVGGEKAFHWALLGGRMSDSPQSTAGDLAGLAEDGVDRFYVYRGDDKELFSTDEYRCFAEYFAF